jgi:hypothetical protein
MRNTGTPIQIYPNGGDHVEDIYIYNNIISGVGATTTGAWCVLMAWAVSPGGSGNPVINNFNFINNTVYANTTYADNGLQLPDIGTATNITIRNNIFQGFYYNPINYDLTTGTSIDYLSVENNIFYGNGTNSVAQQGNAATHYTNQHNLTSNPSFVSAGSDFHLQAGSPAIHTGIYVDIPQDYAGSTWNNPPSIGAYEYGVGVSVPTVTTTSITGITTTSATGGGNVTSAGGGTVSAKGVCWSTVASPTTTDSHTTDGSGTEAYASAITPLSSSTTYYVRAYGTNESGTGYGSNVSFSTTGTASTLKYVRHNGKRVKFNGHFVIYR